MKMKLASIIAFTLCTFVLSKSQKHRHQGALKAKAKALNKHKSFSKFKSNKGDSRDKGLPLQRSGSEGYKPQGVGHNYSKKSCTVPGKVGGTCYPSPSPSSAPSVSNAPTNRPSVSPSQRPSLRPSFGPTLSPSISQMPSFNPSESSKPSSAPSDPPTTNLSSSPTRFISPPPSTVPSGTPTITPSNHPSEFPTKTSAPSFAPSVTPTLSSSPSSNPTNRPSDMPSLSWTPTEAYFQTDTTNGFVSTCEDVPVSGTQQVQTFAFRYNMFIVPSANAADSVYNMETALHFGLVRNFLTCTFGTAAPFHIVSIDSKPEDNVMSSETCDTSVGSLPIEPTECVLVNAAFSMTASFPIGSVRRLQTTEANPEVQDATGDYLNESMRNGDFERGDIVQVTFLGFVNAATESGTTAAGDSSEELVTGAITGGEPIQPGNGNSNVAAGSAVVGIAAMCFLVAAVVAVRHRNSRRAAYIHHLDELSVISKERADRTAVIDSGAKVEFVNEVEEVDSLAEILQAIEDEKQAHTDVHNCASATCRICRDRDIRPTFIASKLGEKVLDDLRQNYPSPERRSRSLQTPRTPDTVEL